MATARLKVYRLMDDAQLAAALHDLERQLERLDDATWPAAGAERARVLDEADAAREELDRRVIV